MPKCVHCLQIFDGITRDHVLPSSWYPDATPEEVQRWTVPSCEACNNQLSRVERELLIRMGLCVDPERREALGISTRALRSLGIGAGELREREAGHRRTTRERITGQMRQFEDGMEAHVLPGFERRDEMPQAMRPVVLVSAEALARVTEKIARGCEFRIGNERYVEPPYTLEALFPTQEGIDQIRLLMDEVPPLDLGPGLHIARRVDERDPLTVLYRLILWGTLTSFAAISRPED